MRQEVRDPRGIVHVGLAPRTFRMCWAFASTSSNRPSRMCQPSRRACSRETRASPPDPSSPSWWSRSYVPPHGSGVNATHAGHDQVLVNVETGAALEQDFHRASSSKWRREGPSSSNSSSRAPGPFGPWPQSGVLAGSRVQLQYGLMAPGGSPTSIPPPPSAYRGADPSSHGASSAGVGPPDEVLQHRFSRRRRPPRP